MNKYYTPEEYRALKEKSPKIYLCLTCQHGSKPLCNYCIENGWVQVQTLCTKECQEKDGFDEDKVSLFYEKES
jgi:hypothetical protein